MAGADDVQERDAAVWAAIGGRPDELDQNGHDVDAAPAEGDYVTREEFEALKETVLELASLYNQNHASSENLTTLDKYSRMVLADDGDTLSASDRRAVAIHRHWQELAKPLPNGALGLSTKRRSTAPNQPSRVKVVLQEVLGEELYHEQIYRAMKRTAELSGGSAEPDQYGRMHVVGGAYEFHERITPDNQTEYKVLVEP